MLGNARKADSGWPWTTSSTMPKLPTSNPSPPVSVSLNVPVRLSALSWKRVSNVPARFLLDLDRSAASCLGTCLYFDFIQHHCDGNRIFAALHPAAYGAVHFIKSRSFWLTLVARPQSPPASPAHHRAAQWSPAPNNRRWTRPRLYAEKQCIKKPCVKASPFSWLR